MQMCRGKAQELVFEFQKKITETGFAIVSFLHTHTHTHRNTLYKHTHTLTHHDSPCEFPPYDYFYYYFIRNNVRHV